MINKFLSISLLLVGFLSSASAQTQLLEKRASDVAKLFRSDPGGYSELFTAEFLSKVPTSQLTAIFKEYYTNLGKCIEVKPVEIKSKQIGKFTFYFEKGFSVPVDVVITAEEPYMIAGLLIGLPVRLSQTLTDIVEEIKKLPEKTAFLAAKLENEKILPIVSHNADQQMAIGSTFKLYVLAALIRDINMRKRRWDETVTLQEQAISLPSGILQNWPVGSPLTLHSLASLMISQSDNTATDQLLQVLGRQKVEEILYLTNHSQPEKNIPFLSTLELFKMKGDKTGRLVEKFIAATDTTQKRKLLETEVAQFDREKIEFTGLGKPKMIDKIEWFASADDLAKVLNWILKNTKTNVKGLQILSINPGLDIPRERWNYVGYKGGSEPGVLNMSYLLQSNKGEWYVVIATWNNEQESLEESKLFSLMIRTMQILQ
jgi:beta-lactamase class A